MPFRGRMLVGLDGRRLDEGIIRYAAMVARAMHPICTQRELALVRCAPCSSSLRRSPSIASRPEHPPAEIRFVSVLERQSDSAASHRATLAEQVDQHFPCLDVPMDVRSDLLKGRPFARLPALAADFDSDLLLLDESLGPRRRCARLAITAPSSVWLVPRGWAPVLRRILVPVDFTAQSLAALQAAFDLAGCFPTAKCIALHMTRSVGRLQSDPLTAARRRELGREFDHFAAGVESHGVPLEPRFVAGNRLGRATEHAARQTAADLTVLVSRRRAPLAAWFSTSEVEAVMRDCPGPILSIRSADPPLGLGEAIQRRWHEAEMPQFG